MNRLILASGSAARQRLLKSVGLSFEVIKPLVDEDSLKASLLAEGLRPRDIADRLAEEKALKVSRKHPEALVIGSDQILEFDGNLISKAETREGLAEQLGHMQGRPHTLFTAAVIAKEGVGQWRYISKSTLTMRSPSPQEISDYIDRNWETVKYCVGGYEIEGEGIRLFQKVEGDLFSIQGLPLMPLINYLLDRKVITP